MSAMLRFGAFLLLMSTVAILEAKNVNYSGYKVLTITPKSEADLDLLHKLRKAYSVDLWNEPKQTGIPVMTHLKPELINPVEQALKKHRIPFETAFSDLQSVIESEKVQNAPTNASAAESFDVGKYHPLNEIENLVEGLAKKYPQIAKLELIGKSYEHRPIYSIKISAGKSDDKPAIMMECGIHSREWSSVAAGAYLVNKLVTAYGSDPEITSLVDKYEFNIILSSNPDGYFYSWRTDRMWRKTRSPSRKEWLSHCIGTDANRNFDIDHCGVGTSTSPCEQIYCGDSPFSESETRALRDLMVSLGARLKLYVSLHAFSQLWMTPYGIKESLPPNYSELERIGRVGISALAKKHGTQFRLGSIANIIYEASGSSVDYAYVNQSVKIAFVLELRDRGKHGFFLPQPLILPMCEETFDGLKAAIKAL